MAADIQQRPYPYYRACRMAAPVHKTPDGHYLVTSYELVAQVLRDPKVFSSMAPHGGLGPHQCEAAERLVAEEGFGRFMPVLVNNDPPSHSVYRKFAMRVFRPSRVRALHDQIALIADSLTSELARKLQCDAVRDFAIPMQLYVIADQLGIDRADFRLFREWSDAWLIGLGVPVPEAVHFEAAKKVVAMQHYLMARIAERRRSPREDILSDLVLAEFEGERPLTDREVLSIAENFLVAGNETTSNSIGMGLLRLARDTTLQAQLRNKPEQIAHFVQESLRLDAPVQMMPRYVTTTTELGGVRLEKGAVVMAAFAAANRDDSRFSQAEDFSPARTDLDAHLSFGLGIHSCVGSQLAKLVLETAFKTFLERLGPFTVADPSFVEHYYESFVLRGLTALPLAFEGHREGQG